MIEVYDQQNEKGLSPGQRLQVLIDELHMTQTALAKQCDVSPQYVNNIIRGEQRVTQDFAVAVTRATSADLNWLFTGAGPMLRPAGDREGGHEPESLRRLLEETAQRLKAAADRIARRQNQ